MVRKKLQTLEKFSNLLRYPKDKKQIVEDIEWIINLGISPINRELTVFLNTIKSTSIYELQEIYTANFDMNPNSHMYMGHHFYGESYKRSNFMIQLKEEFRKDNFEYDDNELPDFLPVLLDYMVISPDEPRDYIISKIVVPVLEKIVLKKPLTIKIPVETELRGMDNHLKEFKPVRNENRYMRVLHALLLYLQHNFIEESEE